MTRPAITDAAPVLPSPETLEEQSSSTPGDDATSKVLLLRLAAPLQSWGESGVLNRRDTRPEPTKSGVIGLLAAALGLPRDADLTDLTSLVMAVRTEQAGSLLRDYHTVSDYRGTPLPQAGVNAKGVQKLTSPPKHTHLTWRYYLQDAAFLVGLQGEPSLLGDLAEALARPAFPLALGRRSCPPTQPIALGLRDGSLRHVMKAEPWQPSEHIREALVRKHKPAHVDLPVTLDDDHGTELRQDVPVSFEPHNRRFTERRVRHLSVRAPSGISEPDPDSTPDANDPGHDPFALLGW